MNVAVAEEPAHSDSRKPRLTTSSRPDPRMSVRVGCTSVCTTVSVRPSEASCTSRSSISVTESCPMNDPR